MQACREFKLEGSSLKLPYYQLSNDHCNIESNNASPKYYLILEVDTIWLSDEQKGDTPGRPIFLGGFYA